MFTLLISRTKHVKNDLFYLFSLKDIKFTLKHFQYMNKQLKLNLKTSLLHLRQVYITVYYFPNIFITKKPKEIRMGRGKGLVSLCIKQLNKGSYILNIRYVTFITCA